MTSPAKPHKFVGTTEAARAAQLANLTPAAAVKHGAYSPGALRSLRTAVLDELLTEFGLTVRRDWLELYAAPRARVLLLTEYIDEMGIVKHRKHATVYPAVERLVREETRCTVLLERIEAMHREVASVDPQHALHTVAAEIVAARDNGQNGAGDGD